MAAWEGKPDSFRASVLRGMMHFMELYHGEFSEERLIRALRSVHPMEIYRSGMDNPAKLPGWKKYVFPIYMAYNGKCRKDALPMKFLINQRKGHYNDRQVFSGRRKSSCD